MKMKLYHIIILLWRWRNYIVLTLRHCHRQWIWYGFSWVSRRILGRILAPSIDHDGMSTVVYWYMCGIFSGWDRDACCLVSCYRRTSAQSWHGYFGVWALENMSTNKSPPTPTWRKITTQCHKIYYIDIADMVKEARTFVSDWVTGDELWCIM